MPYKLPTKQVLLHALGPASDTDDVAAFNMSELFAPLKIPGPSDWLANHEEQGQTFQKFLTCKREEPTALRRKIYILPIGSFDDIMAPDMNMFVQFVQVFLQCTEVSLLNNLPIYYAAHPQHQMYTYVSIHDTMRRIKCRKAMDNQRLQLNIKDLLKHCEVLVPQDAFCLIGVTLWDLYMDASDLFVVGWAGTKSGIFSSCRYDPIYEDSGETKWTIQQRKTMIMKRSFKTIIHEILHMFGFTHCIYYSCLMNGTASINEDDNTPMFLCPICLKKLHHVLQFSILKRYQDLYALLHEKLHFKDECEWLTQRIGLLCSLHP